MTIYSAIYILAGLALFWYSLTGCYVLVMHAQKLMHEGRLNLFWKVNVLPWAFVGIVLDIAFNLLLGWAIFGEWPWETREWTFSQRVKRWYYGDTKGWRWVMARWWAKQLNAIDPTHI